MGGPIDVGAGRGTAAPQGAAARWWAPGGAVAAGAFVVGTVVAAGWSAYEAGGCGDPGAKFACLVESLVAAAAAVVLGPLLLWWAFRRAGVRRAFLSVLVAAAVSLPLLALAALVDEVRLLAGYEVSYLDSPSPLLVGAWLGLAALAGGLALQGPRRRVRGGAAAVALVALVAAAALLQDPADRARDALDLDRAVVPLLLPGGWLAHGSNVSDDGTRLTYAAVPPGWDGWGGEGPRVEVTTALGDFGDDCDYRACTDLGDVRVAQDDDDLGTTTWRVVDGALVTVRFWDPDEDDPQVDLVDMLKRLEPVDREEFLDRRYDRP